MKFIVYLLVSFSFIYSQCDEYGNENQCINDNGCEWVEEYENMNCGNYDNSQTQCQQYSEYGCSWEF